MSEPKKKYHAIVTPGSPAIGPLCASELLDLHDSRDSREMLIWWENQETWTPFDSHHSLIKNEADAEKRVTEQERIAVIKTAWDAEKAKEKERAEKAAAERQKKSQEEAEEKKRLETLSPKNGFIRVFRNEERVGDYPEADLPALLRAKVLLPTDNYISKGMSNPGPLSDLLLKLLATSNSIPRPAISSTPAIFVAPKSSSIPEEPRPVATPKKGEIVCPNPNCGFVGRPKKIARGSIVVGVILLFFWIIPGVIYFMFFSGYRYCCPRCQFQINNDN